MLHADLILLCCALQHDLRHFLGLLCSMVRVTMKIRSQPYIPLVHVQVIGQAADLIDLQKILKCSKNKLSDREQQNMTVSPDF